MIEMFFLVLYPQAGCPGRQCAQRRHDRDVISFSTLSSGQNARAVNVLKDVMIEMFFLSVLYPLGRMPWPSMCLKTSYNLFYGG